jgi:hypothetical protein
MQTVKRPSYAGRPSPRLVAAARAAMLEIVDADVGEIIAEQLFSDGIGFIWLVRRVAGEDLNLALRVIKGELRRAANGGMHAGGIKTWAYFEPALERARATRP